MFDITDSKFFTLLSFYNSQMDIVMGQQLSCIVDQLSLCYTIFEGRLIFILSEVSTAQGFEKRNFAKNYAFTGKRHDLAGYSSLLTDDRLQAFKKAYKMQHFEDLTHIKSLWIGDPVMCHSYLSQSVKIDAGYQLLYDRVMEAYADVTQDEFDDWAA